MTIYNKGFVYLMTAQVFVEGFAPFSRHYRRHLLPLHQNPLLQQCWVSSSSPSPSPSFSSRLPKVSSISRLAVKRDDNDNDNDNDDDDNDDDDEDDKDDDVEDLQYMKGNDEDDDDDEDEGDDDEDDKKDIQYVKDNDNDDDDEDLKYVRDYRIWVPSEEYVDYIRDNEAALLAFKVFCEWTREPWDQDDDLLEQVTAHLELLREGSILPATKRLRSSRVEDAMDCLSCLDRKTIVDKQNVYSMKPHVDLDKNELDVWVNPRWYYLYVVAGCPFAARPWCVLAFYGLTEVVRVNMMFPAATRDREWFFYPLSDEEDELVQRWIPEGKSDRNKEFISNLRDLYMNFDKYYIGHASAHILGTIRSKIISNRSLPIARWLATKMRVRATQHADVNLFPCPEQESDIYVAHEALLQELHDEVTTAVYKIHALKKQNPSNTTEWEGRVNDYHQKLGELQTRIFKQGPYLFGETIRFADFMLFISLVRLDLVYCDWLKGDGSRQEAFVQKTYPILWDYLIRILKLPSIEQTVFPGDIMALYFLTPQFAPAGNIKTVPPIPDIWRDLLRLK